MQLIEYNAIGGVSVRRELCCALGFFDGVHRGHRHLIKECIRAAKEKGLAPAVLTFPAENFGLKENAARLYTTEEKKRILEDLGIEVLILCDFDTVRGLTPEEFVNQVIQKDLNCRVVMSGEGFRFGKGAQGDAKSLISLMAQGGGEAITVPDLKIRGVTVSSTEIRRAIEECKMEYANDLLGAPYFISGVVRHGRGEGRLYGFPTVNTELNGSLNLKRGVYKSSLEIDGASYTGLTNIGLCPTFGKRDMHAETMILGFEGDLYGRELKINLLKYIRDERKFDTPEDLKAQIDKDIAELE